MTTAAELLVRIDATTESLRRELARADAAVSRSSRQIAVETSKIDRAFATLGRNMRVYAAGIVAAFATDRIIRDSLNAVQQTQRLNVQLERLTGSQRASGEAQEYLTEAANRLNAEFFGLADSYVKLLPLVQSNLLTTAQARDVLEGFANVAAATGATSSQLGQSLFGLAQGLSAGTLRAEELNQITEPLPGLLQALDRAAQLPAGGFRKLVVDGQVTSDMLRETLIVALEEYEGAAEATSTNVSAAFTRLQNAYNTLLANLSGAPSDGLVDWLDKLSSLLRDLDRFIDGNPKLFEFMNMLGRSSRVATHELLQSLGIETTDLPDGTLNPASPLNNIPELNTTRRIPIPADPSAPGAAGGGRAGGSAAADARTFADVLEDLNSEKVKQDAQEVADLFREGEEVFRSTRTETELLAIEQERLARLYRDGAIDQETFTRAMRDADAATDELGQTMVRIGDLTSSAFEDAIIQGESLRNVIGGLIEDMARIGIRSGFNSLFSSLTGSLFGGGAVPWVNPDTGITLPPTPIARAAGGPVEAGMLHMVGERGPELFVPSTSGTIVPNHKMGGMTYSPVINVDARNSTLGAGEIRGIVEAAVGQSVATIRSMQQRTASARI